MKAKGFRKMINVQSGFSCSRQQFGRKHHVKLCVGGLPISSCLPVMLFTLCLLSGSCRSGYQHQTYLPFVAAAPPAGFNDAEYMYIRLDKVPGSFPATETATVIDLADNRTIGTEYVSSGRNQSPEYIRFRAEMSADEPLKAYYLVAGSDAGISRRVKRTVKIPAVDSMPVISFLKSAGEFVASGAKIESWAETIAASIMHTYPDPADMEIFAPGEWNYTNGFMLNGLCYLDQLSGSEKYGDYAAQWFGHFIDEEGKIDPVKYVQEYYRLDDILPGRALLFLYERTREEKYLKAAGKLVEQLHHQPRTSEGGFWHKQVYDWQMWLDGVYMSDVFLIQYGRMTNQPRYTDEAIHQIKLVYKHTYDPKTGLLFHGWDESKSKVWADPVTGASPEIWGRGLGWYMMALVDALELIPVEHPERADIMDMLQHLSDSLKKYQHKDTGLWFQVIDKEERLDNWPETSCSAMFAYSYLKGSRMGYLDKEYGQLALKAYEGIKKNYVFIGENQDLYLTGTVKVGTLNVDYSDGSYEYYISVDKRVNDFKGMAALLYLAVVDEFLHTK